LKSWAQHVFPALRAKVGSHSVEIFATQQDESSPSLTKGFPLAFRDINTQSKLLFRFEGLLDLCMDWQNSRFDWNQIRAFWATAETGSLSAAARLLEATQPTISRQVYALEKTLNITLFERSKTALILTPIGKEVLEQVRHMGSAAHLISRLALAHSQEIEGIISISASEFYAASLLPPILVKLKQKFPEIDVRIISTNQATDLLRHDADIAIRNFKPTEEGLIATRLPDDFANLYATPQYLAMIGNPSTITQFNRANFIGFASTAGLELSLIEKGFPITNDNFKTSSDSMIVQWELVRLGLGIGIAREEQGDQEPLVVRILPDFPSIAFPVWLVTHAELRTSKRVRIVFDFLKSELQKR
jgi:DNA-binding transcriptional LysR family regulator